jgi:hypothetical protein
MLLLKTKMSERRETKNPLQVPKAKSSWGKLENPHLPA